MKTRTRLLKLQAEAFRNHGITREQFLKITPAELRMLNEDALREWSQEKEMQDVRTARVIAAIYNASPNRKKGKTFSEKDFLPKKKNHTAGPTAAANLMAKVTWIHHAIHADAAKKKKQNGS